MNEVLHANIFFVIASIGTILFILFTILIMWQILRFVKSLRNIADKIEQESDNLIEDISSIRSMSRKGAFFRELIKFFFIKK